MNTLNVDRKWYIGSWLRAKLLNITDNVFPVVAPENAKGDVIVYRRTSIERSQSHIGYYLDTVHYDIVIISDSYDRAAELGERVDDALSGTFVDEEAGKRFVSHISGGYEDYQDGKYYNIITFKIY